MDPLHKLGHFHPYSAPIFSSYSGAKQLYARRVRLHAVLVHVAVRAHRDEHFVLIPTTYIVLYYIILCYIVLYYNILY